VRALKGIVFFLLLLGSVFAQSQQFDVAFGVGALTSPANAGGSASHAPVTMGGGAYPAFSADYLFKKNLGLGIDVAWRASRNLYLGVQPYRPILYDINGMWAPALGKHAAAALMGGIGGLSTRFYQPFFTCSFFSGCTNFTTSNHFLGHFGAALRVYVMRRFFIGPEAHLYLIRNNDEFNSGRAARFGASIGYTFTSEQY
jgi:hypothetical protein